MPDSQQSEDAIDNAAESITTLWEAIQGDPIDPKPWKELIVQYKKIDLHAQRNYATQQHSKLTNRQSQISCQEAKETNYMLNNLITKECSTWTANLEVWLKKCRGDWISRLYLSRLLDIEKGSDKQNETIQICISQEPIPGETFHWLGLWRLNSGDHKGAISAFKQILDVRPLRFGSMLYLGEALLKDGNTRAAEVAFTRASKSNNPAFLQMMALKVFNYNYWKEAIAILERSLELDAKNQQSIQLLAKIYWDLYELSQAEKYCKKLLELDQNNQEVRFMLNALPGRRGDAIAQLNQVEQHYEDIKDPQSRLTSSIAMASLYVDNRTAEEIADLHTKMCAPINNNIQPKKSFNNIKDEFRPLRIGLVSGDFHRQHPVNLFMLPLIENINRDQYKIFIFNTGQMHDDQTLRAKKASNLWVDCGQTDDSTLQQIIINHKIDILIDLAGHTNNHRLGVFALRAAPIQTTFLGYPHSTGLREMDWIIGDAVVSPSKNAHLFSEKIAQLKGSVFCWSPVDHYPLPSPRKTTEPIVFGSFNNVMKLSPSTIRLWASILRKHPDSILFLKAPSLRDQSVISRFKKIFCKEGVQKERLQFEGPSDLGQMMQRYGDVDIALDPTPYNGGTTTLQALWMGTPVITLEGRNFVSRMGSSFLQTLGKKEWVAHTYDEYRSIATDLVQNIQYLRVNRSSLRQQMQTSQLSNLPEYTKNFELKLRQTWQSHCRGSSKRILEAES